MRTTNLRANQLSPEAYEWYLKYLKALDTLDIEAYGKFLAQDCSLQSNNEPPMEGKDAVMQGLASYWTTFASLEHELLNIYGSDSSFVLEALNHYNRHDGKAVNLPLPSLIVTKRDWLLQFDFTLIPHHYLRN
ncbi:nuclear transport factor 2 family protein [Leptolyngbya sp. AN03gr2]|uniref:nuclear transport factor 2 family protein n=1 Tax=unclassified Leptolyngbya TaxID=2650499 RepID=UPI003D31CEEA